MTLDTLYVVSANAGMTTGEKTSPHLQRDAAIDH
jgi:hypothetical protein